MKKPMGSIAGARENSLPIAERIYFSTPEKRERMKYVKKAVESSLKNQP